LKPISVYVGADMRGNSTFFTGSLDEILIYDRPLSGYEVGDLATQSPSPAADGLVLLSRPSEPVVGAKRSSYDPFQANVIRATNDVTPLTAFDAIVAAPLVRSMIDAKSAADRNDSADLALEDPTFVDSLSRRPLSLLDRMFENVF
jgi:hypothetical protein